MKKSWKEVKLGDYISIKSGLAYKGEKIGTGDSIILGMGCVSFEKTFVDSGARPYDDDSVDNRFCVVPGDIVLATRQQSDNLPILAMPAVVPEYFGDRKLIFGTNLYKVENNSEISNRFLFWLLKNKHYVAYIAGVKSGTAVQMVTKKNIEQYRFLCPPKEEREKIADILWLYEKLIQNNIERIKTLEQMAENLYKEWFVRFRFPGHENAEFENGIPKGWEKCRFSSIANILSGGTPNTDKEEYYNGDIPFYTPKDSTDNYYVFDTITKITEDGLDHCNSRLYSKNTIIITARGTVGNLNLLGVPMAMNQSCYAINSDRINSQLFLFFLLKREILKIKKVASGGVFDTIIVNTFDHIKVVLPPDEIIAEFDNYVSPLIDETYQILKKNNNLIKQRDLLLPRLMSGKLEV